MFKTTHTATKAETYLKVMLDYKINSQQRTLLRQVTSEILSANGNAYDVAIAFMIGQLNALSDDYEDPSHTLKIAQYVAEKNIVLSEMNMQATVDWHHEIRSLTQKYVVPQTEEYLSQEETAAIPESEEEPLLLETPTESHGGVDEWVSLADLVEHAKTYDKDDDKVSKKHEAIRYLDTLCAICKHFIQGEKGIFRKKYLNHYQIGFIFGLMKVVLEDHMDVADDNEFIATASALITRHFGKKDLISYFNEILADPKYGAAFQKEGADYMRRYLALSKIDREKINVAFPHVDSRPGDMLAIAERWAD